MSNKRVNDSIDLGSPSVEQILSKIGTVLSRTKDALLKDFLQDIPSYLPELSDTAAKISYDNFKSSLKAEETPLSKFIESLFTRLGYDISLFEHNKEMSDLIKSILATTMELGETIKQFTEEDVDWLSEAQKLIELNQDEKDNKNFVTAKEFFRDADLDNISGLNFSNDNVSVSIGFAKTGSDKISQITRLIVNLISLVKKFKDIEIDKLMRESEEFGLFLSENFFDKKFAEHLFDHILVVLLRNAKEVFADDIQALANRIKEIKKDLEKQVDEELRGNLNDLIKQIEQITEEIKTHEKQIETEAKNILAEAEKFGKEAIKEISTELRTQHKIAKAKLEELTNQVFGDYNQLGRTFNQLYAVFDFLQVIDKKTIEVAKYIPEAPDIPTIPLDKVDSLIAQIHHFKNDANKTIEEANQNIDKAVSSLKSLCPTVEIYVINWKKLIKVVSTPLDYFKTLYPIKDYDDAEKLLAKIIDVIRAFNNNIPDFSSLKQLLYELLIRVRNKIKDEFSPLAEEAKRTFAQFENFILDLLKVLEKFAIGVKKELQLAYDNFIEDKDSLIKQLESKLNEAISEFKTQAGEFKSFTLPHTNIKYKKIKGLDYSATKKHLTTLFVEPFIRIVTEKAQEHELFCEIKDEDWQKAILNSINANEPNNLIQEYKVILEQMEESVTQVFEPDKWQAKFELIIAELKDEFERQTKNIPDSFDELKNYFLGPDTIQKLMRSESWENPFSDFDFNAYISILSNKLKTLIPDNPDIYYIKFRAATISSFDGVVSSLENNIVLLSQKKKEIKEADYNKKLKAFTIDVFTAYWSELKNALYKALVRPFMSLIETGVKAWSKEILLPKVIDFVVKNITRELNFAEYKEIFKQIEDFATDVKKAYDDAQEKVDEIKEKAKNATEMVMDILMLSDEAKNINSWQDGLQFSINLYRLIPSTVKTHLRELIDLPNWNLENIDLPDYKLDINNKFFALTLYEHPDKTAELTKKEHSAVDIDVSFRLVSFVGDRKVWDKTGQPMKDDDGDDIVESGLYFLPIFRGKLGSDFNLGKKHYLNISANSALNPDVTTASKNEEKTKQQLEKDSLGFFFTTKDGEFWPSVELLASDTSFSAYLELLLQRGQKDRKEVEALEIFKAEVAELSIKNYPQKLFIGYTDDGFDCGYLGKLQNLALTLKLHTLNDFFATILKNDIVIELEKLNLGYSIKEGFRIEGDYSVQIPINTDIDIKAVKFKNINLELGSGNLRNLIADLKTNFVADFHGVTIAFSEMGFGIDFNYLDPDGSFGDLDITPHFKFPDGIAIAIDTSAVKGAGILKWNKEKEEFLGAVELNILELCSANAMILFNMKMPDGSKGFSFMGALSVFFTGGIQIGMGFSITAIGGSLGINRRIDQDKLINAVRNGSLSSILFVKDLEKNLDLVLSQASTYYPIKKDQLFFGFLTQITWGEIVKADLGLFIQAPDPVVIIIAGSIKVSLADKLENLLSLNVQFLGSIDFSKGLSFDAALVDSHIVGITFHGSMAFRLYWAGETKGFLFSVGGFHPQYKPEADFNVSNMNRLGMKLNYSILKLSLESYFAITSNTVQFGAKITLQIGWSKFGIYGYLYFNALFQFKPFMFMFDVGAGLAVKLGKLTLFSISVNFALSGPAPWNAKGKASFKFIITYNIEFNVTWGKKQDASNRIYIDIMPLYIKSLNDNSNWKIKSTDLTDNLVNFTQNESLKLVLQPSDTLSFIQNAVPLNQKMERYGEAYPNDIESLKIKSIKISGQEVNYSTTQSSFAPTLIREYTDEEKIAAPSYQKMQAGFDLQPDVKEEKAASTKVNVNAERYCQDISHVWDNWENYLKNIKKPAPQDKKKIVLQKHKPLKPVKEINRLYKTERILKKVQKPVLLKTSLRKSNEGFKRYTRQLDSTINNKMDKYLDMLDGLLK
jgi:hypothetical protein